MGPLSSAAPIPPELRTFVAPTRYVQGPGALDKVGNLVALRRSRAYLLVDMQLTDTIGVRLAASLNEAGVATLMKSVDGEVTWSNIDALAEHARSHSPDVVVAAGGGKVLDQGKGIARTLDVPIVTVPTIASNDGPTSRVIALYDEQHQLVDTPHMQANPELVVVDTTVIAAAPIRFLLSGIGDALAKKFEAEACARAAGLNSHRQRALALPAFIADGCFDELVTHGADAVSGSPDAVERVVEACVLMSGMAFENGGLSMAHAMTRGLMACPGSDAHLHGFHVAYGLLVQLAHEDHPSYAAVRQYLAAIGLPCSLTQLDTEPSDANRRVLAQSVLDSPHRANCDPYPSLASLMVAIDKVEVDASTDLNAKGRTA